MRMRSIAKAAGLSVFGSLLVQQAIAAPVTVPQPGLGGPNAASALPIERVQSPYYYDGRDYCWYPDGWRGPGWYWCGYRWRRGYGWGGPYGWNGWAYRGAGPGYWRGGPPGGWRGGPPGRGPWRGPPGRPPGPPGRHP